MCTPSSVEVIEVVFVSTSRGDGTPGKPNRSVFQYWSKNGHLLAESDSLFEDPERASHYAVERLMQLRGISWKAAPAGEVSHA
jgi:hypothetical protein